MVCDGSMLCRNACPFFSKFIEWGSCLAVGCLGWSVSVKDALELILRRAQGQLDQTSFAMIVSSLQQGVNNTSLDAWSAESDLAALLVREPQLSEEVCTYGSIECYEL
jgi:hypothetical protein